MLIRLELYQWLLDLYQCDHHAIYPMSNELHFKQNIHQTV